MHIVNIDRCFEVYRNGKKVYPLVGDRAAQAKRREREERDRQREVRIALLSAWYDTHNDDTPFSGGELSIVPEDGSAGLPSNPFGAEGMARLAERLQCIPLVVKGGVQ